MPRNNSTIARLFLSSMMGAQTAWVLLSSSALTPPNPEPQSSLLDGASVIVVPPMMRLVIKAATPSGSTILIAFICSPLGRCGPARQ